MIKKFNILMAFDGSNQSLDAVRYISRFFPPDTTQVNLFHVATELPEAYLDLGRNPAFRGKISSIAAWASGVKKNIEDALTQAESLLYQEGYAADAVKSTYHVRETGVARDILAESRNGYDALVVGRSGVSQLQEVVLGSVVSKLISTTGHLPLAVVGACPETDKILIGFDGSKSAQKGVDCVCNLMVSAKREVMLCYVVRSLNIYQNDRRIFDIEEEKVWLDENRQAIDPVMLKAEENLIEAGFHPDRTHKQILENRTTRAGGIVQAARTADYGTIVVGRRGLSFIQEIIMGRVSHKVLHMGKEMAVWIV